MPASRASHCVGAVLKEFTDSRSVEKPKLTDREVATQYPFSLCCVVGIYPLCPGKGIDWRL